MNIFIEILIFINLKCISSFHSNVLFALKHLFITLPILEINALFIEDIKYWNNENLKTNPCKTNQKCTFAFQKNDLKFDLDTVFMYLFICFHFVIINTSFVWIWR